MTAFSCSVDKIRIDPHAYFHSPETAARVDAAVPSDRLAL
jgi:hypothetical protein